MAYEYDSGRISGDENVEVYSIHSSSSSDSDSSDSDDSSMLDYDAMWNEHVVDQPPAKEMNLIATQPPGSQSSRTPKTSTPNKQASFYEKPANKSDEKAVAKKAPKVFLSPQQKDKVKSSGNEATSIKTTALNPGSNVTMLEAVVTNAAASVTTQAEDNKTKKKSSEKSEKKPGKPKEGESANKKRKSPSDSKKDTVQKSQKSDSASKPEKKGRGKKDSSETQPKKKSKAKKETKSSSSSSDNPAVTAPKPSSSDAKPPPQTKDSSESIPTKSKTKKETVTAKSSSSSADKPVAAAPAAAAAASSSSKSSSDTKAPPQTKKRKSPPTPAESMTTSSTLTKTPLKKKKKRTFAQEILYKMLMSCKPFTLKSLAHSVDSTEAAIHHVMLSLVDKGVVIKKEFITKSGRSKELYWANQDSCAKQVTDLVLPTRDEMTATREEYASFQAKNDLLTRELTLVQQELSNEDLDKQLAQLQQDVDALNAKLKETKNRIAAASQQSSGATSSLYLKKQINHYRNEWKNRKQKTMDFVEILADGMEKPIKAVVKLLDIETDEMEGVTLPPKHDVK